MPDFLGNRVFILEKKLDVQYSKRCVDVKLTNKRLLAHVIAGIFRMQKLVKILKMSIIQLASKFSQATAHLMYSTLPEQYIWCSMLL